MTRNTVKDRGNHRQDCLWEFFQNQVLNARNAFSSTKTPYRFNQFGFTLGGPVHIPRVYDGHNRTFFFESFQWTVRLANDDAILLGAPRFEESPAGAASHSYTPSSNVIINGTHTFRSNLLNELRLGLARNRTQNITRYGYKEDWGAKLGLPNVRQNLLGGRIPRGSVWNEGAILPAAAARSHELGNHAVFHRCISKGSDGHVKAPWLELRPGSEDALRLWCLVSGGCIHESSGSDQEAGRRRRYCIGVAFDGEAKLEDLNEVDCEHFNGWTPENAFKWRPVHPEPDTFRFDRADPYVDFALKHGMKIHGHTLAWSQINPAWLFQGHFDHIDMVVEDLETMIQRFGSLGLKVSISELDIAMLRSARGENPYPDALPPALAKFQAQLYARLFQMLKRNSNVVERVTFWGVSDKTNWRSRPNRQDHPMLWDKDNQPKEAFYAVLDPEGYLRTARNK